MFFNLNSLKSIDDRLKIISDAILSDSEIDYEERISLAEKLKSFSTNVTSEIKQFENRYSVELLRTISLVIAIVVTVFSINLVVDSYRTQSREVLGYTRACSEGNLSKCAEGIGYYRSADDAQRFVTAYYNKTGVKLSQQVDYTEYCKGKN